METICLYKTRKIPRYSSPDRNARYKQLCTGEWVVFKYDYGTVAPFTSVQFRVTCPNCLDLLIPKLEAQLNKMKSALEQAKNERSGEHRDS